MTDTQKVQEEQKPQVEQVPQVPQVPHPKADIMLDIDATFPVSTLVLPLLFT